MAIFKNKNEEIDEEELEELEEKRFSRRKFKDLNPQNKRKRKEPPKPWGKKERIIVLSILLLTVLISLFLDLSSRNFKFPGLPRLKLTKPGFGIFKDKTIIIGNRREEQVAMKEKIIKEFNDKTKELSGVYALYVVNLDSNYFFGVGEDEIMQAASLIKLPLMLFADGKVDDAKIEAMGKRSDNTVFKELVNKFGQDNLQKYIDSLGMTNTSLEKNETTPKEIGNLLANIYRDQKNSVSGNGGKILGFLTETIFESWLRAGIPQEIKVAHKYGREVHVINDAGIVFSDKPFVLVIMTDGVVEREADGVIPELAKLVYEGLK